MVNFTFNGRQYQGYQGDTLASALLANGEHFVARSWKYHRPRGIVTAGVEEPNAVVQLETGAYTVPNARATEIELYQGLVATSVNAKPSRTNAGSPGGLVMPCLDPVLTMAQAVVVCDSIEGKKLPAEVLGIAKRVWPSLEQVEAVD